MIYTCSPHFPLHFLSPSSTEAMWYQNSLFQFQDPTAYIFNSNCSLHIGYRKSDSKPQFVVMALIIAVHTIFGQLLRLPPIIIICTRISINSTNVNSSLAGTLHRVCLTCLLDHSVATVRCRQSFTTNSLPHEYRSNKPRVDGYSVPIVKIIMPNSTIACEREWVVCACDRLSG